MANEMTCDNFVMTEDGERFDMAQMAKGDPGFSPIANVTQEGDITTITITDLQGTTTAEIDNRNKASWIYDTAAGDIVSFPDGADNAPMKALVATIEPVQDLHGYDHPWPAGGGKNLCPLPAGPTTSNGVTFTPNADGSITISGDANATAGLLYMPVDIPSGTQVIYSLNNASVSADVGVRLISTTDGGAGTSWGTAVYADTVNKTQIVTTTFDVKSANIFVKTNHGAVNITLKVMIELGRTASVFEPYANICPITGWTWMDLYHEAAYDPEADPITTVNWQSQAGTVYGGTLDVITGLLTVDRESFAINGSTTISTISELTNTIRFWIFTNSRFNLVGDNVTKVKCDRLTYIPTYATDAPSFMMADTYPSSLIIKLPIGTCEATVESIAAYLAQNPIQFVLPLATPQTYQLDPVTVNTLLGNNVVYTDVGPVSVTAPRDTKMYVDRKIAETVSAALNP